jgi:hypothetical protein
MKNKGQILVGQIALASILAYSFATSMFASTTVPTYKASFLRRAFIASNHRLRVAQGGVLGKRLHKREQAKTKEVEQELEKNPKLVDDPNYLAQHPGLAQYIKNHPEAKQEIEQDPRAFFANMESRSKHLHDLYTIESSLKNR